MKHRRSILLSSALVILALVPCSAAAQAPVAGEEYVGTWNGAFEGGAGTGTFEITLAKDAQGALVARIAVTAQESYTANFRTIQFDGNRMKGAYGIPPEELVQVNVDGIFEPMTASGTWSVRDPASGNELGGGTWTLKRTR